MSAFLSSLSGVVAIQGGALAILAGVITAILRGALVPRATLERLVSAAERREAEWRSVAMTSIGQTDALLVTARVAQATLSALPTDGSEARP